ncbi:Major Facilitator Superfamily protein [Arboricoccus pini]|uniref:Major Facilitator Superfamily protein n=1 Tax=Arboricoccus pini TaxID=1963835 RepID=A0A212RFX2_9PROT|nr:MFS transporter [Arboricoccus pini]SNB71080.1 Major Facilitator Superfamily protein [Arboricoccus pini]
MATDDMREGRRHQRRVILASCVGSALEWYDFFIYSSAAALVFGRLFFTNLDPAVGTLVALATFGVGFLSRPLGGIVFGHLGDRLGRKPILVATLLVVGIGTALIGVLPTYATIGIWAPILLVCLRLVQGFGAGAEYGGAVIMLVEHAPPHRRGFWGSFAPLGVGIGMMLASATFALVSMMPEQAFLQWGWRVPFLLSIVMVAFGIFVRARLSETPVFEKAVISRKAKSRMPILDAIRHQPRSFLVVLGARLAENGHGFLFPVFGLSYAVNQLGVLKSEALVALMTGYLFQIPAILGFSMLSDKIGRRPVYIFGALFSAAISFPFFAMLETNSFFWLVMAFVLTSGVGTAAMFGTQAAYFAELFGPSRRFSGFAFARELGSIIAGGPAPAVSAALVAWASGASWPVALYAIVLGLLTAVAVWFGPETYRSDITADERAPTGFARVALRPA